MTASDFETVPMRTMIVYDSSRACRQAVRLLARLEGIGEVGCDVRLRGCHLDAFGSARLRSRAILDASAADLIVLAVETAAREDDPQRAPSGSEFEAWLGACAHGWSRRPRLLVALVVAPDGRDADCPRLERLRQAASAAGMEFLVADDAVVEPLVASESR